MSEWNHENRQFSFLFKKKTSSQIGTVKGGGASPLTNPMRTIVGLSAIDSGP